MLPGLKEPGWPPLDALPLFVGVSAVSWSEGVLWRRHSGTRGRRGQRRFDGSGTTCSPCPWANKGISTRD
jgi:hypothetical protein